MTRRLLPYEHQLVEALGISQEDYLEFVALQKAYNDPKSGTVFDIRNDPATVAIVLTVVGILFQVGAALLAPKPELPQQKAQRRQREERFAPSTGFNSTQELANYGDPVNLIYCNTGANSRGAVRAATSLVWSAVRSYGSSQFMQLLLVLGASEVNRIDYSRIGIGDVPLSTFNRSNTWLYYNENGAPTYEDIAYGNASDIDPTIEGRSNSSAVCLIQQNRQGFSQAFSPSNRNTFGVYDPVPINVRVMDRRRSGNSQWANNLIVLPGNPIEWAPNGRFSVGNTVKIEFKKLKSVSDPNWAARFASEQRDQLIQSLQRGSIYQLGMARLVLVSDPDEDISKQDVVFTFKVVRGGRAPYTPYRKTRPIAGNNSNAVTPSGFTVEMLEKEEENVRLWLEQLQSAATKDIKRYYNPVDNTKKEGVTMPSRQIIIKGQSYTITDDLAAEDIKDNAIDDTVQKGAIQINAYGVKYNFTRAAIDVTWTDETGKERALSDAESKAQGLRLIDERGSLAYTEYQLRQFLADKPKLDAKALRDYYGNLLVRLQTYASNVASGKFDDKIRASTATQLTWIDENNVLQSAVFSLAASGYSSDTRPLAPKFQIERIRSDYKNIINDLERQKEDFVGTKAQTRTFRNDTQKKIEDARENRRDAVRNVVDNYRDALIQQARNNYRPFVDIGGLNRIAGIRSLRQSRDDVKGKNVTDQNGVAAVREVYEDIIQRKEEAIQYLNDILPNMDIQDNSDIFTKALVKVNTAWYQTISDVDFVQFALKARLFRRVSGRQTAYGSKSIDAPNWFSLSDNGLHARVAFFVLTISRNGSEGVITAPRLFAVRGTSDTDMFLNLGFSTSLQGKYRFAFAPVADFYAEMQEEDFLNYAFIEPRGERKEFNFPGPAGENITMSFLGRFIGKQPTTLEPAINEGKPRFTNPWDLFSPRADTDIQFSFENGPEFAISAVTEQQKGSTSGKYQDMSTLALGVFSGQGMQDLRSVTAYVTQGKTSYVIDRDGNVSLSTNSTCYAPDIFLDTVKNNLDGIGNYAEESCIDLESLANAKRYCVANNFFMDGVIAEQRPWREFWAEVAQYSLLEFARKNGREALVPALPHNKDGSLTREITPTGLFTSGNILEGTYKEEHLDYGSAVQDLIATVIYRDVESSDDVFSPKASVTVKRTGTDDSNAIRQTFDLSQFVSTREQAIVYAKYQCNQRRFIRKGIEFKTLPTQVPIEPGGYILVDMGLTPWDNLTTGVVMEGGELNSPLMDTIRDGTYTALLYKDSAVRTETNVTVTNGVAASLAPRYVGFAFVLGEPTAEGARTCRVTEVTLDEEGEVTVKAIRIPCDIGGSGELLSRVADLSSGSFVVTS